MLPERLKCDELPHILVDSTGLNISHWLAAASGYNCPSLVETGMFRYKTIIGRRPSAWSLPNQRAEAKIACNVLNRMTHFGHAGLAKGRVTTVEKGKLDLCLIRAPTPLGVHRKSV